MCLLSRAALAQSDADRAAAQVLFEDAKKLKDAGDLEPACKKFQASQKLDPAVGTQLNLADCYEQIGKTASAWVNFVEASESSEAGDRRAAFAKERAEALRPRLTKLVIEVAAPVGGLTITRGDVEVSKETWGTPVPVDPGRYTVRARAPGHQPWAESVEAAGEGETITLRVPGLLEADEEGDAPGGPDAPSRDDGTAQRVAGGVVLGLGVAGLIAGGVLAGLAHSKAAESADNCQPDNPNLCTRQEDVDLRREAQALQKGYIGAFAGGGAAVVAGLITLLTAPDGADEAVALDIGPTGFLLRGRF
jgi:tetratricopeptide (TPR) repeat protein